MCLHGLDRGRVYCTVDTVWCAMHYEPACPVAQTGFSTFQDVCECYPSILIVGWRDRNQQDATNMMFIIKLLSQHVSGIIMPIIRRTRVCAAAYDVLHWLWWLWLCGAGTQCPSSTQPQPSQPVQNTICGSAHSFSPNDGHNYARNMLR